jgi:KDO2-lipid IV(A) lauroyltransferase
MLLKLLVYLFACIPMPLVMGLARLLHPWFHRAVIRGKWGLRAARIIPKVFADRPPEEHERILGRNSLHLLKLAGEMLKVHFMSDRAFRRRCYIARGEEHLQRLRSSGKGYAILTCHLGNWEWAAGYLAVLLDRELYAPVFVEDSEGNRVLNWIREGHRVELLPASRDPRVSGRTLVRMIRLVRRGEVLYLVADQAGLGEGYRGTFFGAELSVFGGPFILGARTGTPFLPLFTLRDRDNRLALHFEQPFHLDGEDPEGDVARVMSFFEQAVSAHPEQYLWSQDRW